jgi:phosphotransferase system HPr (HPr) family protein
MKTTQVTVKFPRGLHLRPAARLIQLIRRFRSQIHLRCGQKLANGRSLLNILLLGAAFNAEVDILASGEDEEEALHAVEIFFKQGERQEEDGAVQRVEFDLDSRPSEPSGMEGPSSPAPDS